MALRNAYQKLCGLIAGSGIRNDRHIVMSWPGPAMVQVKKKIQPEVESFKPQASSLTMVTG